jgi:hypothetical protein
MSSWSWKIGVAGGAIVAATAYALAQMPNHAEMQGRMGPGGSGHQQMMSQGHPGMHGQMVQHQITQSHHAGQEAFGTIQEIVQILEQDPTTDWSKVNISALRQHLIDMDEVTLRAAATEQPLDNGVEIAVTGAGRTLDAIKRMIPAHLQALGQTGWNARIEDLPNGLKLTVTSPDTRQATRLKALGFMGLMVQGEHHQAHHLMMARGQFAH